MLAAVVSSYGEASSTVDLKHVPIPQPGSGEVLIKVIATTLNRKDIWAIRGLRAPGLMPPPPLPHVNGADGAVVPVRNIVRIPPGSDMDQLAAAGVSLTTAWRALIRVANARPDEKVMVVGASGGTGCAALQVAKLAGCEVIAVVGGEWKVKRARELGADHVIDYFRDDIHENTTDLTDGRGVDVVIDMVGADTWPSSINSLSRFGRMVVCGATSGDGPTISIRELYRYHRRILGTSIGSLDHFRVVLDLVNAGRLQPVIHASLPLTRINEALTTFESRDFFGKLVLRPHG